ncbi:MAG TPA: hypothetical protein VOA78_13715 [Candidatus Dormibacteraeota bacterium]|nr:hypothetical protein [Candidatus Dormibacteraeota bacterium]
MAEKSENKPGPKQDDLISKLVKDPKAPPDALLLSGFVGASSEEGHTRLYLTATLEDYVEIPNDAILLTQEIPKDQSPMGGTLLWIKSDAELIHGKVGPNRLKAKFLEGRIQQEFVRAQAAGAPGAAAHFAAGQQFQPSVQCLTVQACSVAGNCPTTDGACTVVGLNCPSQQGICTAIDPNCVMPTQQFPCAQTPLCPPTQSPACPTHHVACTVDIRACINTANPQCPIKTAFCPTPACPTHHVVACTIGGPACGVTGPQCPVQTALCQSVFQPCLTHNQPICQPSLVQPCVTHNLQCAPSIHTPCLTQHQPACNPSVFLVNCPTQHLIQCLPSVHTPCFTANNPICQPSVATPCLTQHGPCTAPPLCPIASGGFGCGPQGPGPQGPGPIAGAFAGGVANAAAFGAGAGAPAPAFHLTSPVICQPVHTLFCPQTQHFVQCHPTILCHTQQIICLQVTQVGCPFPSQFCPSAFCPSGPACGGGGFGGFGGLGQ